MEPPESISVIIKPRQNVFKNKFVLLGVLLISVISGFVIYRSFASTEPTNQTNLEGNLEIVHKDDFTGKKSDEDYTLVSSSKVRTKVTFASEPKEFNGSPRVRLKGTLQNGTLAVKSQADIVTLQTSVVSPKAQKSVSKATLNASTTSVTAENPHKTAVVLYNYVDNRSQPISVADVRAKVFEGSSSVNAFFKEESYGARSLVGIENPKGDVFGYVTIASKDTSCNYYQWTNEAQAAIAAQGHKLDDYDNLVFISPAESCDRGGYGQVSGRLSWVFVNSANSLGYTQPIVEHEMTHNFGTWHANSSHCVDSAKNVTSISDDCINEEYGDPYDIMGYNIYYGHTYHSNSYFLSELGWLPPESTQPVNANSDYVIIPQGSSAKGTKALRILRSYDQFNTPEYLYLEYRQPSGVFDNFTAGDEATKGAMVRLADKYLVASYALYVPHKAAAGSFAYDSTVMHDGEVISDASHGLTIKQVSHNSNQVVIHIDQPNPPKPDTSAPSAPKAITRKLGSTKVNVLQWEKSPESDTSYYEVYRDNIKVGEAYNWEVKNLVTYEDWAPLSAGNHSYYVRAIDYAGNASSATEATFVTPPVDVSKPTAPTGLKSYFVTPISATTGQITGGSGGQPVNMTGVKLVWRAASDNKQVIGYVIYRKDSKGVVTITDTRLGYGSILGETPVTSITDYWPVGSSTTYYVVAYDLDLNMSSPSGSITVKAPPANHTN